MHNAQAALEDALETLPTMDDHRLCHGPHTGARMSVQPYTINGTDLGDQEYFYVLFLCYIIDPPDLPSACDGFGAGFSVNHALYCKKGGLVTTHHNNLCDRVADMSGKEFTPTHVRKYPLV